MLTPVSQVKLVWWGGGGLVLWVLQTLLSRKLPRNNKETAADRWRTPGRCIRCRTSSANGCPLSRVAASLLEAKLLVAAAVSNALNPWSLHQWRSLVSQRSDGAP